RRSRRQDEGGDGRSRATAPALRVRAEGGELFARFGSRREGRRPRRKNLRMGGGRFDDGCEQSARDRCSGNWKGRWRHLGWRRRQVGGRGGDAGGGGGGAGGGRWRHLGWRRRHIARGGGRAERRRWRHIARWCGFASGGFRLGIDEEIGVELRDRMEAMPRRC